MRRTTRRQRSSAGTRDGVALILRPIARSGFTIEKRFNARLSPTTGDGRLLSRRAYRA